MAATGTGCQEAGFGAGQRGEDAEHQPAIGCGGVDRRPSPASTRGPTSRLLRSWTRLTRWRRLATEPIELPDHERIASRRLFRHASSPGGAQGYSRRLYEYTPSKGRRSVLTPSAAERRVAERLEFAEYSPALPGGHTPLCSPLPHAWVVRRSTMGRSVCSGAWSHDLNH
jgi:hypothetical protein